MAPYFNEPFYVGFAVAGYELGLLPDANPADGALIYWGVESVADAMAAAIAIGAVEHTGSHRGRRRNRHRTVLNANGSIVGFIATRTSSCPTRAVRAGLGDISCRRTLYLTSYVVCLEWLCGTTIVACPPN